MNMTDGQWFSVHLLLGAAGLTAVLFIIAELIGEIDMLRYRMRCLEHEVAYAAREAKASDDGDV